MAQKVCHELKKKTRRVWGRAKEKGRAASPKMATEIRGSRAEASRKALAKKKPTEREEPIDFGRKIETLKQNLKQTEKH